VLWPVNNNRECSRFRMVPHVIAPTSFKLEAFMRLDRHDIFPLIVILIFGFAIPIAWWVGFGSRQQVIRDLYDIAKYFAFVGICVAPFVAWFAIRVRRREKRFLTERGEQTPSDFAALFEHASEQRGAKILFHRLRRMTATGRMPRLQKEDRLTGPPLFLVPDDLTEEIEELCKELDICTALDPDAKIALYSANTVAELVAALARFIEQQGLRSDVVTSPDM